MTLFALRHGMKFRSGAGKFLSSIAILLLMVSIVISVIRGEPENGKKGSVIPKVMFGLSWVLLIVAVIAEIADAFL